MTDDAAADTEPLTLAPPRQRAPRRPPPVVAAIVPVGAACVMWLVTGSAIMLLFAALGPLLAAATLADGAWAERRLARSAAATARLEHAGVERAVAARHAAERTALRAKHPDAGALLARPAVTWSTETPMLVLGAGAAPSTVRVQGGGDPAAALRRRASTLPDAPVVLPATVDVCVVGPPALARAVARALVLQLCLTQPPQALTLVSAPAGEDWAMALPHRRREPRARRLAYADVGDSTEAELVIAVVTPHAPVPARCAAVLTLTGPARATLRHAHDTRELTVEGVSRWQAHRAAESVGRLCDDTEERDAVVALGPLLAAARAAAAVAGADTGLAVPIGLEGSAPAVVDLVADGPHAVVAGVTGSGKSELLVTWVTALCATRSAQEVTFLLADFKGGTAFEALATLPHVTGVITDLDPAGALRAIQSLRAELRRREAVLAAAGARGIDDARVRLPRLVIVVDEFAALLAENAELHAVFTDVAARGRALGMHLVLGTQRAAGVVRDALLANCPLRISLRVTDAADSRALVGTDQAALFPGGVRGLALVRRAGDASARPIRVALSSAAEIALGAAWAGGPAPHRPWLPALPPRLALAEAAALDDEPADPCRVVLGIVDEPDRQRRTALTLTAGRDRGLALVGGAGTGKSTLLALIAEQLPAADVRRVPPDEEAAWDALSVLADGGDTPAVVLIDDVDALAAAYPSEYAAAFAAQLERLTRTAGARGITVVVTAQRLTGPVARAVELLPRRAVLALPTRLEHVAAGADAAMFDAAAPAGRVCLGARHAQLALPGGTLAALRHAPEVPAWAPSHRITALVARSPRHAAAAAGAAWPTCTIVPAVEAAHAMVDGPAGAPVIVVGDGDGWQRQWPLLTRLRDEHELVVDAECPAEFRLLSGRRELPPYATPGAGRAWSVRAAEPAARVVMPALDRGRP